jgi:hypothetical protein
VGIRLGTALVAKGFIAEGTLVRVLSESLNIPMVDLSKVEPQPAALQLVSASLCEQYEVFPLAVQEQSKRTTMDAVVSYAASRAFAHSPGRSSWTRSAGCAWMRVSTSLR